MIALSTAWGICRSGIYGTNLSASDELFCGYGSRVATAVSTVGFGLGVLIGSPITGFLFELKGDYTWSLVVLVACFVTSDLLMLLIPGKEKIRAYIRGRMCRPEGRQVPQGAEPPKSGPNARWTNARSTSLVELRVIQTGSKDTAQI
ncbi:uncharacterized protein LOC110980003 isoform X3 [Acanthaster planci]|uniref:Uncharacterized protein LOC110980003 isoform X3 n=1 Tax=Acanthaster planci TaxID=133434 RepID=A0A8B7YKA7_ACAPL|nr:uncharacterized protein LOC110980003 isoform X3 [Acanthaster planci]XP_022091971.1 uncharacterized protein LOC110980003 isoform X3 [Acanthaster planci]